MSEFVAPLFLSFIISFVVSLILLALPFLFASNSSTYPEKWLACEYSFDQVTLGIIIMIIISHLLAGIFNLVWFQGEVASPLIISGGSSAIFFLFFARSDEEKRLSLLFFVVNNLTIIKIYKLPDLCFFVVVLFLVLVTSAHLFLWVNMNVFFNLLFFSVLLARIFFDHQMDQWGFGLVAELTFLSLFSLVFKTKGYEIGTISYLIPVFWIDFFHLLSLDYGLKEILLHLNFLWAAAALLYLSFFSQNITDLGISFFFYLILNASIGFSLAKDLFTFFIITSTFLFSSLFFAGFFFMKALRDKRPFSSIVLANKREGVHALLVVYFLVLAVLLSQLNPGSATLSLYSNWLMGLGLQIGFLTALNYFFKK